MLLILHHGDQHVSLNSHSYQLLQNTSYFALFYTELNNLVKKIDGRIARLSSAARQGFRSKPREPGSPSTKPLPKSAKKWALTPEAQSLVNSETSRAAYLQPLEEEEEEDSSELAGIDFSE